MKWYKTGNGYTDESGRFRIENVRGFRLRPQWRLTDTSTGAWWWQTRLRDAKAAAAHVARLPAT